MKTKFIRDNSGNKVEVIDGLAPGDILICQKDQKSIGDVGLSGLTYKYTAFESGKEYEVYSTPQWGFEGPVPYVMDEDATLHFATPEIFKVK